MRILKMWILEMRILEMRILEISLGSETQFSSKIEDDLLRFLKVLYFGAGTGTAIPVYSIGRGTYSLPIRDTNGR